VHFLQFGAFDRNFFRFAQEANFMRFFIRKDECVVSFCHDFAFFGARCITFFTGRCTSGETGCAGRGALAGEFTGFAAAGACDLIPGFGFERGCPVCAGEVLFGERFSFAIDEYGRCNRSR
jgi:hypothetical protein